MISGPAWVDRLPQTYVCSTWAAVRIVTAGECSRCNFCSDGKRSNAWNGEVWGMMRRQVIASAAALALFMPFDGGDLAVAQEAGGGTSGTPRHNSSCDYSPAPPASQTTLRRPRPRRPLPLLPQPPARPQHQKHRAPSFPRCRSFRSNRSRAEIGQARRKPKKTPTTVAAQPAPPPPAEAATAPEGPSYAGPLNLTCENVADRRQRNSDWKVPTAVGRASAADIQRTGDVTVQNVLQSRVPESS